MPPVEIKVTLDPHTGRVNVHGPLHLKMPLVYMLEEAKRLVLNFDPTKQPKVVLPDGPLPSEQG